MLHLCLRILLVGLLFRTAAPSIELLHGGGPDTMQVPSEVAPQAKQDEQLPGVKLHAIVWKRAQRPMPPRQVAHRIQPVLTKMRCHARRPRTRRPRTRRRIPRMRDDRDEH